MPGMFTTQWIRLFLVSCAYYTGLYFSINNRSILVLTLVYAYIVWRLVKHIPTMWYLVMLATLPFAKGYAYEILLLPLKDIHHWALYDIKYFFPVYLSDLFFGLAFYTYVRKWAFVRVSNLPVWPLMYFGLFIVWSCIGVAQSAFFEVGLLSCIQIVRLFVLLCLPSLLGAKQKTLISVTSVFAATLLFESVWAIAQVLHGGPLGRDIEVYLPGARFGVGSSENAELLRVTGTFFESSILGTFLLTNIGVLLGCVVHMGYRGLQKTIVIFVCIVASIALVFTGSRMLYGLWIFLIWYMWAQWKRFGKQYRLNIGVVVGVMVFLLPYLYVRITSIMQVLTEYGTATYRLEMMQYAMRIASMYPWFGVGLSHSPYYYASLFSGVRYAFDPTYPHNFLFQMLMETGVIGLGIILLFVVSIGRLARNEHDVHNPFMLGGILYLVCAMVYPIFINHQEIVSYAFVFLGLFFATRNKWRMRHD